MQFTIYIRTNITNNSYYNLNICKLIFIYNLIVKIVSKIYLQKIPIKCSIINFDLPHDKIIQIKEN